MVSKKKVKRRLNIVLLPQFEEIDQVIIPTEIAPQAQTCGESKHISPTIIIVVNKVSEK